MKYAVTFTAMDTEAGSNMFWHSFLMFSQWDAGQKIEITAAYGFYGLPSTTKNSGIKNLKSLAKLDVDIYGNHGWLCNEQLRNLELGVGVHGVTFELTPEQFEQLKNKCTEEQTLQQKAVDTAAPDFKGKENYRIHSKEEISAEIFAIELAYAKEKKVTPRLKEFSLGFVATPYTCKSWALEMLKDIIPPARLENMKKNAAFPRFSGSMENLLLHSEGPLQDYQTRSGAVVHSRDFTKEGRLYWTLPPQLHYPLSEETRSQFHIPTKYAKDLYKTLRQLQKIEWICINATLPKDSWAYLTAHIHSLYQPFALIKNQTNYSASTGLEKFLYNFFELPENLLEKELLHSLMRLKNFMLHLYSALVDDWSTEPAPEIADINDYEHLVNHLHQLSQHLTVTEQQKICGLIGRNYLRAEESKTVTFN